MTKDDAPAHCMRFAAMGSPCEVWFAERAGSRTAETLQRVVAETRRLETAYSHFRADSELSIANARARRGEPAPLSDEFVWLLDRAADHHRRSLGQFDVTTGALTRLWRHAVTWPGPDEIARVLAQTGLDKLAWSDGHLRFSADGVDVDLGGVVKEYAVDRAAGICLDAGHGGGFVSFGGDVRVFGPQADGAPWRLGITSPHGEAPVGTLFATAGAVATSGDYERFRELDGRRCSHLVSPRSGLPIEGAASITIAAETCLEAGLLATSALLQGAGAEAWLLRQGCAFAIIGQDGEVRGPLIAA